MLRSILLVCFGGALGSLLRYLTSVWLSRFVQSSYPWATFAVNIIGCLLIGFFYALFEKQTGSNIQWRLFFMTGFCGGLTTFSAFTQENFKLLQDGNTVFFLLYTFGSITLGLLAFMIGLYVAKSF